MKKEKNKIEDSLNLPEDHNKGVNKSIAKNIVAILSIVFFMVAFMWGIPYLIESYHNSKDSIDGCHEEVYDIDYSCNEVRDASFLNIILPKEELYQVCLENGTIIKNESQGYLGNALTKTHAYMDKCLNYKKAGE